MFFWNNNPNDPDWKFTDGKWAYVGDRENYNNGWCDSCGGRNCIC